MTPWVAGLRDRLRLAPDRAAAERACAPPPGVGATAETVWSGPTIANLGLDPPVDTVALSEAWGLDRPGVCSFDVHQRSWQLVEITAELPDPHGRRVAAEVPSAGPWELTALLAGRPPGPLPATVAGASPFYELTPDDSVGPAAVTAVVHIEVRERSPLSRGPRSLEP